MRFPKVKTCEYLSDNEVRICCDALDDVKWFDGHFPQIKIYPAVGLISTVAFYTKEYLKININDKLDIIPNIKFQSSVLIDSELEFKIKQDGSFIIFTIRDLRNNKLYSDGKFRLIENID